MCTQEDNYDKKAKQEVIKQEVIVLDAEEDTTAAGSKTAPLTMFPPQHPLLPSEVQAKGLMKGKYLQDKGKYSQDKGLMKGKYPQDKGLMKGKGCSKGKDKGKMSVADESFVVDARGHPQLFRPVFPTQVVTPMYHGERLFQCTNWHCGIRVIMDSGRIEHVWHSKANEMRPNFRCPFCEALGGKGYLAKLRCWD